MGPHCTLRATCRVGDGGPGVASGRPIPCSTSSRATEAELGLRVFTPGWRWASNCGLLYGGGWGADCRGLPCATPWLTLPLGLVPNSFVGSIVMALTFAGNGIGQGARCRYTKKKEVKRQMSSRMT